ILSVDPARAVDATTLQSLKDNALSNWILEQHALSTTKITPVDQNKLLDSMNMPPGLPLAAPSSAPGSVPGAPSGAPGSVPGQP
ncbi:MAG: hypothetical protein ACJ795_22375, partial [Ktedonobacteraceae bacterium]